MTALDVITQHRQGLDALCRRFSVRRLRLFGSGASGEFDLARSDIDLLVDFAEPVEMNPFRQFIDLKLELERLLGRDVDLVEEKAVTNPYFRANAEAQAVLLYAA